MIGNLIFNSFYCIDYCCGNCNFRYCCSNETFVVNQDNCFNTILKNYDAKVISNSDAIFDQTSLIINTHTQSSSTASTTTTKLTSSSIMRPFFYLLLMVFFSLKSNLNIDPFHLDLIESILIFSNSNKRS